MRHVFGNHSECSAAWAKQSTTHGRNKSGNLNFDGPLLSSYSTPIAELITNERGERAVLVTDSTYSQTTSSKHMPAMWGAINYGRGITVFRVPSIRGWGRERGETTHEARMQHFEERALDALAKAERARSEWRKDSLRDDAENYRRMAREYAAFFNLNQA